MTQIEKYDAEVLEALKNLTTIQTIFVLESHKIVKTESSDMKWVVNFPGEASALSRNLSLFIV